jgi:hypothetical protein
MAFGKPEVKAEVQAEKPKGPKPVVKIYATGADGKMDKETEIAMWEQDSKVTGKKYLSGKDKKGNKYVGFY